MKQCSLCLQSRVLRKSHLIPKSLYKVIRSEDGLVYASRKKGSIYTDKQIAVPLLCGDCEEMFSKKGEQVVCKECYRGKGNFILRDKLKATSEMFTEGSKGWIIPQTESRNINLDYEAYLYFGASIIWRASAGKWPSHVGRMRRGLGKYEDKIRRYLLGETDFPKKVFLLIGVNSDDDETNFSSAISFPFYEKLQGHHRHIFYIPGVNFIFTIGRMSGIKERAFTATNTPILFDEQSFKESEFFKTLPKEMLEAKGRLANEKDELEK